MKLLKKADKNSQIGLDIGSHTIKAVAITYSDLKPQLVSFSVKPIGDNIVQAIKDTHAELGLTKNSVVTSIAGPAVIARYIEMPSMNEEELISATRFEAEKVIPYDINDVELDACKIEDLEGNRMRVIIVAVKKELVESQLNMIFEAGLEPLILDVDSFAVMNAFVKTGINNRDICALVNIGAKRSNLNIIKGDISYICRDIDMGSNDITKTIVENLSLPLADAEKLKEEKASKFLQLSGDEKKDIEPPLAELFSRLSDEIRLSFDFYENQYAGNVSKVYISGGISKTDAAIELLKENLGCEILRWNPLTNIDLSEKVDIEALGKVWSQLAVAVGLGLRRLN